MVNVCAAFSVAKVSRINMVDRVSKHVQSKISGEILSLEFLLSSQPTRALMPDLQNLTRFDTLFIL